jgi:acyl-CoA thioesterase FadM
LHSSAYQVLVCVDKETFVKRRLPDEIVSAARAFLLSVEAARAVVV